MRKIGHCIEIVLARTVGLSELARRQKPAPAGGCLQPVVMIRKRRAIGARPKDERDLDRLAGVETLDQARPFAARTLAALNRMKV
jgi:hypothetical protein